MNPTPPQFDIDQMQAALHALHPAMFPPGQPILQDGLDEWEAKVSLLTLLRFALDEAHVFEVKADQLNLSGAAYSGLLARPIEEGGPREPFRAFAYLARRLRVLAFDLDYCVPPDQEVAFKETIAQLHAAASRLTAEFTRASDERDRQT